MNLYFQENFFLEEIDIFQLTENPDKSTILEMWLTANVVIVNVYDTS